MATSRTSKPRTSPAKPKAEKRPTFAEVGKAAAKAAQRKALLAALDETGWSLTLAAGALGMKQPNVIRALKELAPEEYEAARRDGRISPANRLG